MVVCSPAPLQPWSSDREEDRRFRRILLAVLTLFGILGYAVSQWHLPQLEVAWAPELPPRIARLLVERGEPAPTPASGREGVATAPVTAPAPAVEAPEEQPPEPSPVASPRATVAEESRKAEERVAQSGVLALSEQLAALRQRAPVARADMPQSGRAEPDPALKARSSSRLSAEVTVGSVGLGSDLPSTQAVLGEAGLPARAVVRHGGAGLAGRESATAGQLRAAGPGNSRSQEEIQEILDRNKRAIYALYNRELRIDPTLRGKVVLEITIAPSGEVTACRLLSSELGAASLEQQLIRLIQGIDFGAKPDVPPVRTRVPIEFFPA